MMTSISPLPLDMEWVAESAGNFMFNDCCRGILRPDWSDQFDGVSAGYRSCGSTERRLRLSRQIVDAGEPFTHDELDRTAQFRKIGPQVDEIQIDGVLVLVEIVIKANVETAIRLLDKAFPGRRLTANLVALIDPDATLAAQFAGYFSKVDVLLGHFIPVRHPQPFRRNTTPGMP
ncbi:hypothetical protein [Burkholderia ubonensis]|uniref:hypothetical protein n=1 Tax=Burkholderia ubonensis TaxID=101571 RepID=UPI0012FC40FE|nr:hypothetical protein [Burkholderia ubonensis]